MLSVFKKFHYILLAIFVAVVLLFIAVWMPNWALLKFTLLSDGLTLSGRLAILGGSFDWLNTNFSPLGRILTILNSLLAGINVALLVYHVRGQIALRRAAGLGALGIASGLFGIGCAACGSFLLSSIFGLGVGSALTAALPLSGLEFTLLGTIILAGTTYYILRKIKSPLACD